MASNVSELETEPKSAYFKVLPLPSPLPPEPHISFSCRSPMIPQNDLSSDVETLIQLNRMWKELAGDHKFKHSWIHKFSFLMGHISSLATKPTSVSQDYLDQISATKTNAQLENDRGLSSFYLAK